MTIYLTRLHQNDTCTLGVAMAAIGDNIFTAYTLEPPAHGTHPCIPVGAYPATVYPSPHFGRKVLLLHNVPNRSNVEIHYGNTAADTTGCVIVGNTQANNWVGQSHAALDHLIRMVEKVGNAITVEVIDNI